MKQLSLVKCMAGVFALDSSGKIIEKTLFSKKPEDIALKLYEECPEERRLADKLKQKGFKLSKKDDFDLKGLCVKSSFCTSAELPRLVMQVNKELTKLKVSAKLSDRDKIIIQAVRAHDALEKEANTLSELLREWYSIYFPELSSIVPDNDNYAAIVSKLSRREDITEGALEPLLGPKKAMVVCKVIPSSLGADLSKDDTEKISEFASVIGTLYEKTTSFENYIQQLMAAFAPNLTKVATPLVGARLIDEASSLGKLANMPGSTIQILGAQKSMFRFLKTRKNPPKHGVIYKHPMVSGASKKDKGRVSRSLANKIAIAARADFYSHRVLDHLPEELDNSILRLKNKK